MVIFLVGKQKEGIFNAYKNYCLFSSSYYSLKLVIVHMAQVPNFVVSHFACIVLPTGDPIGMQNKT